MRPISSKDPIHLVFKANKEVIRGGFRQHRRFALIHHILQKYQLKFFIKIEQVSIQGDHIHLLIRTSRRSLYQNFIRVLAGQIAQRFEKGGLLTAAVVYASTVTGVPPQRQNSVNWQGVTGTPAGGRGLLRRIAMTDTPKSFGSKPGLRRGEGIVGPERAVTTEDLAGREEARMLARANLIKHWKYRPFTRVVKSYCAYQTVRDYIQLNEREALGEISYRSQRLRRLSSSEWEILGDPMALLSAGKLGVQISDC